METKQLIALARDRFQQENVTSNGQVIDVRHQLTNLLHSDEWSNDQTQFFNGWMKKIDITKHQRCYYQEDWRLAADQTVIGSEWLELSLVLALDVAQKLAQTNENGGLLLKTCNALFKLLDRVDQVLGYEKGSIIDRVSNWVASHQAHEKVSSSKVPDQAPPPEVLDVTVLFSEGPIARAYLETIRSLGLKVSKIIQLISSHDLVNKKPVGRFLPKGMKASYASGKQFKQMFYWPQQIKQKHPKEVAECQLQLNQALGFSSEILDGAVAPEPLTTYSDQVQPLMVNGLSDDALYKALRASDQKLYLFTGGGIVPSRILSIPGKRFIHVHPGYLPEVKGADCVLWSQLLYQRTSASAFFLAPGIDVGDVILPMWLPQLKLTSTPDLETQTAYRLIYGFVDPWVRSYVLKQMIFLTQGLSDIRSTPQNIDEGMTFHFMHEKLKQVVLSHTPG